MNLKLRVVSMAALFFTGSMLMAQTNQRAKKDTLSKEVAIDEVVVTGYKSKKTDLITQAQTIVGGEALKQQSNTMSVSNMLQGKAPGVLVQTNSGQPGSAGVITIRGFSNFSNTSALVVIDGQYSSAAQLNQLNPSEVESVVILKDAAATAQYGSRASAGVIVVTTRRGEKGKTRFTLESRFGTSTKISDKEMNFQMMDAGQKLAYENAVSPFVGNTPYSAADIATLTANNHNWEKDITRSSIEESYLVTASGGTDKSLYYYSMGYDHNSGIIQYLDGLKRYSGRVNFENSLTDKLKVGMNADFSYQVTENQRDRYNGQNPIYFMYAANAYEQVHNPDGSFNPTSVGFPILEALQNNLSNDKNLRIDANIYGQYKIFKDLTFKSTFNNTYGALKNTSILKPKSYLDVILGLNGSVTIADNDYYNFTTNQRLDYVKDLGLHHVELTAFYEYNREHTNLLTAGGQNYRAPGLDVLSNQVKPITTTGYSITTARTSVAALLDYNYDSRYILSASIRRDGSSRFGVDNKFGNFYSGSVAWNVAKEHFLDGSKLNSLKLRASYGIAGNDAPIPDYVNQPYASFGLYGTGASTVVPTTVGNSNLKFEKVAITNLGIDFEYLRRFRGSVEVFRNQRTNFLQLIPYDQQQGGYTVYDNAGNLENKGLEINLSADVLKKRDWKVELRGNYSNIENKILALREGETERNIGYNNKLKVGESPYYFRLVKSAGVNSANGDALYYTNRTTAVNGETFTTVNGQTATNVYNSSDIQDITNKTPSPKIFGGFGTTISYKNFDLSADFTYKAGGYAFNYQALDFLDPSQYFSNKRVDAINFWRNPGDTNVLPIPKADGLYATDYFLQKTDYIRFRSLNIGYTFDKSILGEDAAIRSIRVYAQGQNLFLWTKYQGDPEVAVGSGEGNVAVPNSYSLYSYPTQKTFTLGIEVQF
jgi:ferric enterobactin receptor